MSRPIVPALACLVAWAAAAGGANVNRPGLTAWGKPVGGLQAGIRSDAAAHRLAAGDVVRIPVVVRNVGEAPIEVAYLPVMFVGKNDRGTVEVGWLHCYGGYLRKDDRFQQRLLPDEELVLGHLLLGRAKPGSGGGVGPLSLTELPPGKYRFGSEQVELRAGPGRDAKDLKLTTGYLDVELLGAGSEPVKPRRDRGP